jgi:tetratricopeptide (TPR) repeat protein
MRAVVAWLCCVCACAGSPPLLDNADEVLEEAQGLLANDPAATGALLEAHAPAAFPKRLQDRYEWLLASARLAMGDPWGAFETIRDFADRHPHSEFRSRVVHLEFEAGRTLSQSDRGFLFFWSDRRAGRTVLEHLITRHPDNAHLADALRILGEMAYADGRYELAQERFRDLLRRRPESEWVPLARFRYAMSIFARQQGPEYDFDRMQHASRELEAFLADPPENPGFVAEARLALATLREWQAERHLSVAAFYQRVGNVPGRELHLRLAADSFPETAAGQEASARLATGADGRRDEGR